MTEPFLEICCVGIFMEDYTQVTNALGLFVDDNSRSEKNSEKTLRHSLEDVVGFIQGALHRQANATRRAILWEKLQNGPEIACASCFEDFVETRWVC